MQKVLQRVLEGFRPTRVIRVTAFDPITQTGAMFDDGVPDAVEYEVSVLVGRVLRSNAGAYKD